MILLTDLDGRNVSVNIDNIKYIEEYGNNNSRIHYVNDLKPLYIKESIVDIAELVNMLVEKKNISVQIYYDKTLFSK